MVTRKESSINLILSLNFAILCIWVFSPISVSGRSAIGVEDELNFSDRLVSQDGNFTLGFFTITDTTFSYLGIWYTNDEQVRKVWVANLNSPITGNSSVLAVDSNGALRIINGGTTNITIFDQIGTNRSNITANLQDSGNFVLVDEANRQILWQSFDHPSNTLMPGMKLGFNNKTGQIWELNSWLSEDIPASGAFKLSWEPSGESGELVISRRGEAYWRSGLLRHQVFDKMSSVNSGSSLYSYNLTSVSNDDEKYFTFDDPKYFASDDAPRGITPLWYLNPNGFIVDGLSGMFISAGDFCYGYSSDFGCVASSEVPQCRSHKDRFEEKTVSFRVGATYDDNSSLSLSDCMERCWNDCNCVAFTSNSNGTGCITWPANVWYEIDGTPGIQAKYLLISEKSLGRKKWWIWIIVAVAISLLLLVLGCYLRRKIRIKGEEKKRREQYLHELTASDSFNNASEVQNEGREGYDLKFLGFTSIVAATNNFSNENKLGEGGFGPVYKGKLQDGREIAIKRLSRTSGQGLVEFKNELILIAKLQHTNLVRVLGCCIHGEEKMLIYEYMPNKSLDFFLFDPEKKELLNWEKRLNIIEGVAQGLLYLHKYSRMRVIHRDLKASNVLLDENMNPKISDFGMARIFKQNETEAITNRVVGTYGYMSPEYAMEGTFSVKSDVFSFGVLLLEVTSGRRNSSFYQLDRPLNLIGYVWELWKEGTILELKDPTLGDSCGSDQLLRIVQVGLLCVQESAVDRPIMSDVISMLTNETMALPSPEKPAYFTGRGFPNEGKSKASSVNEMSITAMEAR